MTLLLPEAAPLRVALCVEEVLLLYEAVTLPDREGAPLPDWLRDTEAHPEAAPVRDACADMEEEGVGEPDCEGERDWLGDPVREGEGEGEPDTRGDTVALEAEGERVGAADREGEAVTVPSALCDTMGVVEGLSVAPIVADLLWVGDPDRDGEVLLHDDALLHGEAEGDREVDLLCVGELVAELVACTEPEQEGVLVAMDTEGADDAEGEREVDLDCVGEAV